MAARGKILFNSSFIGSSAAQSITWEGGRSALVAQALAYSAGGLQLQLQGPSGAWIKIGSSILSDQVFPFDGPAGTYRVTNESASSIIGANVVMVTIPYI